MGAAEHERVDAGLPHRREVGAGDQPRDIALHPALLGERDEERAGLDVDAQARRSAASARW